jgi:hypothetical protein
MIRYLKAFGYAYLFVMLSTPIAACRAEPSSALKQLLAFNDTAKERIVRFDLAVQARCMIGDLEAILLDMKYAGGGLRLQLTVEALGAPSEEAYYGRPLEQKTASDNLGTYEVQLPGSAQPRFYGVFLCSVNEEQFRRVPCSKHKLLTFDEIIGPYKADTRGLQPGYTGVTDPFHAPKTVVPKTYFAQFLIAGSSSLETFDDVSSPLTEQSFARFGIPTGEGSKGIALAKPFSTALRSLPLTAKDSRIQLTIPFFSQEKCT